MRATSGYLKSYQWISQELPVDISRATSGYLKPGPSFDIFKP